MTIGLDCRLYSPNYTGIGRYVFELVKHLIELDQANRYVLFFNQPEYDQFQVPNERWEKRLVNVPHYSLAEQWRFLKILNAEKLDLMHFPHFNAPILYRKPYVVTIHDLTLHYYPYKEYSPKWSLKKAIQIFAYRFLMGQVVKHAKRVIAVSENTKKDLMKEYGISEQKITRIYEGVPENFQRASEQEIAQVRQKFGITKPYLLYTGVWRSHKNLLNLIRAFEIIALGDRFYGTNCSLGGLSVNYFDIPKRRNALDLQLVLTGKKDPAYPEIPQLIAKLNLRDSQGVPFSIPTEALYSERSGGIPYQKDLARDSSVPPTSNTPQLQSEWKKEETALFQRIVLTGFVSDEELIGLMSGTALFVFPSLYEGFGLPPLEAMQLGVPVACSNISSLPEVCGDAAAYFDPTKVDEMAQVLKKSLTEISFREALVQKGTLNVQRFSWKAMSGQILDIYNSICNTTLQTKIAL